jgi:hypothetical protein
MDSELVQIDVLNVGKGHLEVKFEKSNAVEVERARRMIKEMLSRGYAIFVEVDGELKPVRKFDENTDSYIIDQIPPPADPETPTTCKCGKPYKHRGRCLGKAKKEQERQVPMSGHRATAVGRTAGG